jgi:hypothetical protein
MTVETQVEVAEGKDKLEFELGVTLAGGVHVPVEVIIVYPQGNGLHAVQALTKAMETQTGSLFNELLNRQDASLVTAVLARQGESEDDEY